MQTEELVREGTLGTLSGHRAISLKTNMAHSQTPQFKRKRVGGKHVLLCFSQHYRAALFLPQKKIMLVRGGLKKQNKTKQIPLNRPTPGSRSTARNTAALWLGTARSEAGTLLLKCDTQLLCSALSTRPRRLSPHPFRVQTSILLGHTGCQNE